MSDEPVSFRVGDMVTKDTGDYTFDGEVVSAFYKRDGITRRYVVEDDRGCCMIFNQRQLKLVKR